jgi:hypothetical protein
MTRGLEGVDAVLEEGAANLEELKVIWGDPDESLDFDGFCARLSLPMAPQTFHIVPLHCHKMCGLLAFCFFLMFFE